MGRSMKVIKRIKRHGMSKLLHSFIECFCSSKQGLGTAVSDGVGQALGFALALASIATVREILGSGTWFGLRVLPEAWPDWVIMVLPPGAFLTLGVLLGAVNWFVAVRARRQPAGGS